MAALMGELMELAAKTPFDLQSGILEIPQAWIDKAIEINKTDLFIELMKRVAEKKEADN
ncbi:MAG: hypothetical protein KBC07_02505 [Bacteroidales bacterium]|jgi:hypothetical protein|nr:hypothetical protein [Bacteroidales bacterium]NLH23657.1 hypothetical protein [Bacteroidales bacterium]